MVLSADFSLTKPLIMPLLGGSTGFPQGLGIAVLLFLYLLSALAAYLVERRWYMAIEKIVNAIVMGCKNENSKEIRLGAVATIRVSAILLAILSPLLIAISAFILLIYFDWVLAFLTIAIGSAAVYLYWLLGQTTKRFSSIIAIDDDVNESYDLDIIVSKSSATSERLNIISNILQLKSKSRLIISVLFVLFLVGMLIYYSSVAHDANSAYRLIVSSILIYLCFNGMKVAGSKAVPLSRQYNLVKDFILTAR